MTTVQLTEGTKPTVPIHFALIHYGDAELLRAVVKFLRPALLDPKEGIYLCGLAGEAARLLGSLEESVGRDLRAEVAERRIVLGHADQDADQQLQNLLAPVRELSERGLSPVRVVGPAAWGAPGYSAPEDFLWYESRILPGIEGLDAAIMCTYDAARLPGAALLYGALETHSHTMIEEALYESPLFMPADRYLKARLLNLPWLEPPLEAR